MPKSTPRRIVELWPALSDAQREALVDIAEAAASNEMGLVLTPDQAAALERSKDDFRAGRTHTFEEIEAQMDAMLRTMRVKE